jgi:hypothetical protein
VITKSGAVSSWLAGIVSSFQGGDRGVPPCSSAQFGLGPLPRGGPVSVPPAAVRVNAVLPRQAQNGGMSYETFEGVGPRQRAFPTWHVLMRRDSRRPRPGPSGYVGTRARSTEVGADYGGARARPLRSGIASVALILVAFLVAACGGGSSPASVAHIGKSAPTTTVPPAPASGGLPNLQQMYRDTLAYAGCVRTHGDPSFPDPKDSGQIIQIGGGPGIDPSSPQFQAAQNDCRSMLPGGGP